MIDCEGYLVGVGCAELALQRGAQVTYHSPFDRVAPLLDETLEATALRPAARRRPACSWRRCPASLADARCGRDRARRRSGGRMTRCTTRWSTTRATSRRVYRVGDCVAPRILADAIFDGHRLASEIDSEDPAVALPWLRERVALP